jgi:hypothetical protein
MRLCRKQTPIINILCCCVVGKQQQRFGERVLGMIRRCFIEEKSISVPVRAARFDNDLERYNTFNNNTYRLPLHFYFHFFETVDGESSVCVRDWLLLLFFVS